MNLRGPLTVALAGTVQLAGCGEPAPSQVVRAFGTEPFWSVTVGADSIRMVDMGTGDTLAWPAGEAIEAAGRQPRFARAWVLDADAGAVLVVRQAPDGCSDGMSDRLYPWFALFLRGDRLYEGCARDGEESTAGARAPVEPRSRETARTAGDTARPPEVYVDRGACPFECCVYREWVARESISVHPSEGDTTDEVFRLAEGERFQALGGNGGPEGRVRIDARLRPAPRSA